MGAGSGAEGQPLEAGPHQHIGGANADIIRAE